MHISCHIRCHFLLCVCESTTLLPCIPRGYSEGKREYENKEKEPDTVYSISRTASVKKSNLFYLCLSLSLFYYLVVTIIAFIIPLFKNPLLLFLTIPSVLCTMLRSSLAPAVALACVARPVSSTCVHRRFASSASGAANEAQYDNGAAAASPGQASPSNESVSSGAPKNEKERLAAREALILQILSRDKEIFELKRQHELSMLRVEQNQRRILKDQEDRGMYYEQNCNVSTFETVSVGLHTQRSTVFHTINAERLRNVKVFLGLLVTIASCGYLYYRYMINPNFTYVERPVKVIGSQLGALQELQWQRLSDEERLKMLQKKNHQEA